MTTLTTDSGVRLDSDDFAAACQALADAGVKHAQIRATYAEAVLVALAARQPERCPAAWDEDTACALPVEHRGWHASAPRVNDEGFTVAGATWTPSQPDSDYRALRA